ncbi:MAG: phosphatidate cytidylyltransferase, partial [Treponema sp.]|nr:phosphatidate cytidylyltransferase [Treponema sp.]
IGIICAALLLPAEAAKVGIFALSFGDGTASLVGKVIGRIVIPFSGGKTVAGSLTCFIAVYISCFCVCQNAFTSLIIALFAMLIEVLPLKDFDNIVIPIFVGFLFAII